MKTRLALALLPLALFNMAAKDSGCATEEPIVTADAAAADAAGSDCAIPEPCPSGSTFSVANCACITTTPPDAAVADTDASTGIGDCTIPEPSCPPGTQFSVAGCECVAVADASTTAPTCAELASTAQNAVVAAENQAQTNLSCGQDSDCVLANNITNCTDGCGVVLTQAGSAQLQSALAQINATTCATYTAEDCPPPAALPCAELMPHCTNGVCSNVP
jgi:hypothetical protein